MPVENPVASHTTLCVPGDLKPVYRFSTNLPLTSYTLISKSEKLFKLKSIVVDGLNGLG